MTDKYAALVAKLDEYISFVNQANEGPITLAFAHGWRCPQADIDKGAALREEIRKLREAIE